MKKYSLFLLCLMAAISLHGAAKEAETVLGNYLLIPVEPGTHEIVLEFVPQGLAVGIAVSAAAGVLLLISSGIRKKNSRKMGQ